MKDISPKGAFLKRLHLSRSVLPVTPFAIHLRILEGRLKNIQAKGEIVRFESDECIGMGIKFTEVAERNRGRLIRFIA